MTVDLFMKLVEALATICIVAITAYVVPYLKERFTSEQLDNLSYYITVAIRCAEQIYSPEEWAEKKAYVVHYAKQVINEKLRIKVTDQDLNNLIEGLVNDIKNNSGY